MFILSQNGYNLIDCKRIMIEQKNNENKVKIVEHISSVVNDGRTYKDTILLGTYEETRAKEILLNLKNMMEFHHNNIIYYMPEK
jgi:hypothetical protein